MEVASLEWWSCRCMDLGSICPSKCESFPYLPPASTYHVSLIIGLPLCYAKRRMVDFLSLPPQNHNQESTSLYTPYKREMMCWSAISTLALPKELDWNLSGHWNPSLPSPLEDIYSPNSSKQASSHPSFVPTKIVWPFQWAHHIKQWAIWNNS